MTPGRFRIMVISGSLLVSSGLAMAVQYFRARDDKKKEEIIGEMNNVDIENMSEEDQVMYEIKKNERRTVKFN
jgi:hypothetical protein